MAGSAGVVLGLGESLLLRLIGSQGLSQLQHLTAPHPAVQWQPGALAAPASDGPPPCSCSQVQRHPGNCLLCPPPGTGRGGDERSKKVLQLAISF